jgi:hypothetical protein
MSKKTQVKDILSQIKKLDHETKIELMEEIVNLLKANKIEQERRSETRLTDLNELGSEIWKDVNIDQYVERERQWD